MKKSMMSLLLFLPFSSFAQVATPPVIFDGGNFIVCIIAGLLLAVGFQLLLTTISVAAGITAVGNVKKKANSSSSSSNNNNSHDDDDGMNIGQKISTGLGVWTMITTSIALFFASLMAVKLGLTGADFIGATLGLVIWAAFFMLITYLEINAVSSLVGGMVSTVKSGLSSASSIFSKSDESKSKSIVKTEAKEQAVQMRKQFEKMFNNNDIDKKIDDYVQQLQPQKIDINNIKKQVKDLLTDIQVTEKADYEHMDTIKKLVLEEADKSTMSKEDKEAVKNHVSELKNIAQKDISNEEKVKQGIEQLTPADKEQIEKYQGQIRKALENTNKKELQPDQLEQDLKRILNEPKEATSIAKSKASALDRDTLVKILASQNMSEQEANQRVSQAEKVLNKVSSFFSNGSDKASHTAQDQKQAVKQNTEGIKNKIKGIFSGSGGGSMDLNRIYSDFMAIFQSSGGGADLQYKLKNYNKEEMTVLIANRTSMGRAEAEKIADKIVSARDAVLNKANHIQSQVNQKMEEAKQKSLEAAEETRKAAVTAGWWLVATAILSGIASVFGGMLALEGFIF